MNVFKLYEDRIRRAEGATGSSALTQGYPSTDEGSIPQRDYIVPGYIQRGVVTALIGPPGAGKSQLCILWIVALALGRAVRGFAPLKPMRILAFNSEDDIVEQQRRIAAALRFFGATAADLGDRLLLLTPTCTGMLFARDPVTGDLVETDAMAELRQVIEEHRPDATFLDPLTELHSEGENDNTAVRQVAAELRALAHAQDMAVLLIHHSRKGPADPGNPDAARGASSLSGLCRRVLTLFEMTAEEAAAWNLKRPSSYFRLDGGKANYDAKNAAEWFERVLIEIDNGEIVAAAHPWAPPGALSTTDETLETLLHRVGTGCDGRPWTVRLGNYERSIAAAMRHLGITTRQGQEQALRWLFEQGCKECTWRKATRARAEGLRHPNGSPSVAWLE